MDDLHKDIFETWKLRLKLERIKNKLRKFEWLIESEEYKQEHSEAEYKKARQVLEETKKDYQEAAFDQSKLEDKIKLPNPYLKKLN